MPAPDETTADARAALPAYLTAAQVAAMLQLSAKSVFRLAAADATMPQLRLGGSVRFPRERLLRWLRAREGGPVAPARPSP
jgi:excisionase family DNA binding protein